MEKKLVRTESDKMIAGVCGGFAEYFDIDSTIVRLIFVLIGLLSFAIPIVLFYIISYFVIPQENDFR
ncbi:PspC domain-containing protein [Natranaerobius trueperi]|uniref:PspC domain-containing protein n=1 Tax=Natranaerobius trueperi TaxID=759412 RepID=A0A226BXC5_9FIRM|nr:PspC domain-containing protein [Natranaerobius trueperi]OWZ82984.1 PspC domain-containing protein [Natranaerobius trueperi]